MQTQRRSVGPPVPALKGRQKVAGGKQSATPGSTPHPETALKGRAKPSFNAGGMVLQ